MIRRVPSPARPGWRATVESQGLVFPVTVLDDGREVPYWCEDARYELDPQDVDELEQVTEELHARCVDAAYHLVSGAMGDLGLPPGALDRARRSLEASPPSLYGRFDLRWDGAGPAKLLEYNADTPTGLLESSVAQWFWLQDVAPDHDQWNSLHERLVLAWQRISPLLPLAPVYFAHHEDEPTGEEYMTVTYLRDTAEQAGLTTREILMGQVGWDEGRQCFVDTADSALAPIRTCFKLYPWETMLWEEFGGLVEAVPERPLSTTWLEPLWKVVLSNKALLAALWQLFPDHPNLLPAYLGSPRDLEAWVAKPLHGREGDNIRIHAPGIDLVQPGGYGEEGYCYQAWCPLPDFDGNKAVLGSWVVDGRPAGLGIRESDGWVTDYYSRFVPHVITGPSPSEQEREEWLEDAPRATAAGSDLPGQQTWAPGPPTHVGTERPSWATTDPGNPGRAGTDPTAPTWPDPTAPPVGDDPLRP